MIMMATVRCPVLFGVIGIVTCVRGDHTYIIGVGNRVKLFVVLFSVVGMFFECNCATVFE